MKCNPKESYRTEIHENLYDVIYEKMSYWDIINNTKIFKEEDIGFIQEEFIPFLVSAKTLFTEDTVYYFLVDVTSAVKEFINRNEEAVIPITSELIKKYGVSVQEYLDDYSEKLIIESLLSA